ncbi:MAG: redoxin family protein [Gemmatimonadetes bacterium]|nr:redoxin family protein [Gemmatimonadota bacterium]
MQARRIVIVAALVIAGAAIWTVRSTASPRLGAATDPGAFGFAPGELVAAFRYAAVDGRKGTLAELLRTHRAVVVAMRAVDCPVSKKYGHELARLEREYAGRGVAFLYLNINSQDQPEAIRAEIDNFGFTGPYVHDPELRVAGALQPAVTTEVFVIDAAGTLRYRGAVDDQYGITFALPEARERWLRSALDATLDGRAVETTRTEASGCFLALPPEAVVPLRDITYNNRINRIVRENCAMCHHDGGVAPFSLETYDAVYGYRGMIRYVVEERRMPPWFADPAHGRWKNDRTLSDRDRRDLIAWIDAGAPEGDAMAPVAHEWVADWQLPEPPDAVVTIAEPIHVPAEGIVDYKFVYVQTHFGEDKWIRAIEARPSAV